MLLKNTAVFGTAQKMKFSIKDFFKKCEIPVDSVLFTEEILYGKLCF